MTDSYEKMWEDFGRTKSEKYTEYKFNPTHRIGLTNYLRERQIFKFLSPQKEDMVLDVGCASGRQLFELANKIKEGYGTDIAQSFIDKANSLKTERQISNIYFHRAEIEHLPFADNFFDKVFCAEVLEHVTDKDVALRELKRVLKPEGLLIITVPNLNADATWWGRLLRFLGIRKFIPLEDFSHEGWSKHGDAHVREFSHKTMREWLENNGFKVLALKSASFIDGPGFDFLLKFPLHVKLSQRLIIALENHLTNRDMFWGRHLIVKAKKS